MQSLAGRLVFSGFLLTPAALPGGAGRWPTMSRQLLFAAAAGAGATLGLFLLARRALHRDDAPVTFPAPPESQG